jgi:hypothetical protein
MKYAIAFAALLADTPAMAQTYTTQPFLGGWQTTTPQGQTYTTQPFLNGYQTTGRTATPARRCRFSAARRRP